MISPKEHFGRTKWRYAALSAVMLFAGVVALAIWVPLNSPNSFSSLGEFGDFVGGLANPLLALIGLLALLYTIRLQLNELSLSRDELALTREELERSASALEQQVAHLERQQLSQSFFDLFEMYKSVVSEISYGSGENRVSGKAAFEKHIWSFSPSSFEDTKDWSLEKVLSAHERLNSDLGNYFRVIFRLLSFLSESGKDGAFYADIFRAQLTTTELHLLFFNCVSDVGQPMQAYASTFQLFDNMPLPNGNNFECIAKEVDPRSFGKNSSLLELIRPVGK